MDTIEAKTSEGINNHFNGEYTLAPRDLKSVFPELRFAEDFSLIPIFDRLIREFIVDLKQNPSRHSISSFRYAGKDPNIPGCHYFEKARIYDLGVGDSKHKGIISMNIHKLDINPVSYMDSSFSRRHYWMTDKVTLSGNGPQAIILKNLFESFTQGQDLEKLMQETKQEILDIEANRTDTGFSRPKEFDEFYCGEKPTEEVYL